MFDSEIMRRALVDAFKKLDPRREIRNPVMFTVYVGSILTTGLWIASYSTGGEEPSWFIFAVSVWLWFTVLFANFAEAMAEGRGKAQADALRRARQEVPAKKFVKPRPEKAPPPDFTQLLRDGELTVTAASDLRKGDLVFVDAGDYIPADGEVIEGVASVDESAITGESAR